MNTMAELKRVSSDHPDLEIRRLRRKLEVLQSGILTSSYFLLIAEWMTKPGRKPANEVFTGFDLQIASLIETHLIPHALPSSRHLIDCELGSARYEKLRKLNPRQFTDLVAQSMMSSSVHFDDLVDKLN